VVRFETCGWWLVVGLGVGLGGWVGDGELALVDR